MIFQINIVSVFPYFFAEIGYAYFITHLSELFVFFSILLFVAVISWLLPAPVVFDWRLDGPIFHVADQIFLKENVWNIEFNYLGLGPDRPILRTRTLHTSVARCPMSKSAQSNPKKRPANTFQTVKKPHMYFL